MQTQKIKTWLRLSDSKLIKHYQVIRLIEELGDPIQYIGKKTNLWDKIDWLSPIVKQELSEDKDPLNWKLIKNFIDKTPLHIITLTDEFYPEDLKNIYQVPLFLFAIGDISVLSAIKKGAIVGTRKASSYGRSMCNQICKSLCQSDYVIVSGLASGIDSEAHRSTLENNGKTIAVLAHGLELIYPPQNRELARRITENGLLLSEYPPFTKMNKYYFIQRNRIISALCKFTAVIEGKKESGAMITAQFAIEQGKDVFALPGNINTEYSEGPNFLIQQGAQCILNPNSINAYYEESCEKKIKVIPPELNPEEEFIYELIKNNETPINFDEIIILSQFDINKASGILLLLEMKDLIKRIEGNRYVSVYYGD